MRKITGAQDDEWLHWIKCLDEGINEAGIIFEAVMDGEGEYQRVLPQMVAVMRGEAVTGPVARWAALRDWLGARAATADAESAGMASAGAFAIDATAEAKVLREALARMDELEAGDER